MRKKFIFMFFLLLIFSCTKVYALESYKGDIKMTYDSDIDIFACTDNCKIKYENQYLSSNMDGFLYALDPMKQFLENDVYKLTQNIYEIQKYANLNTNVNSNIKNIVYYGYQYKDYMYNHMDKKWYGVTQMLIFETLFPNFKWDFYKGINEENYNSMKQEILDLVSWHNTLPSFAMNTIKVPEKGSVILEDYNFVLDKYEFNGVSNFLDVKKENNKLIISSSKIGSGSIALKHSIVPSMVYKVFVSDSGYNLVSRGIPNDVYTTLNIEVGGGLVIINRSSDSSLSLKSVYGVYEGDDLVSRININDEGFGNVVLSRGAYTIKEIEPAASYEPDNNTYRVMINDYHLENNIAIESNLMPLKDDGKLDEDHEIKEEKDNDVNQDNAQQKEQKKDLNEEKKKLINKVKVPNTEKNREENIIEVLLLIVIIGFLVYFIYEIYKNK